MKVWAVYDIFAVLRWSRRILSAVIFTRGHILRLSLACERRTLMLYYIANAQFYDRTTTTPAPRFLVLSGELAPRQEVRFIGCAVELALRPRSWSHDHFVLYFVPVVVVAGNNYTDGGGCRSSYTCGVVVAVGGAPAYVTRYATTEVQLVLPPSLEV